MVENKEADRRKERATQRRALRRGQILDAARKVFSRKGYHACAIADILKEAGIARGTFYLYYPSKRAIFEALLDQMLGQITGCIRRIQLGPQDPPPLDQMFSIVRRIIDVLETNRDLTIILLREAVGLDADFDQKLDAFYERLSLIIEGALRLGREMSLVRECDERLVAYCVLGSLKEAVMQVLLNKSPGRGSVDRDRFAREILQFNLRGLFV